jgi:SAM-dependent methyltransferase
MSSRCKLDISHYVFGSVQIAMPVGGVNVACCGDCGLLYKTVVPSPCFLQSVVDKEGPGLWQYDYDYASERRLIESHSPAPFDLLDVGAGDGGLLTAAGRREGRRSALDIARFPTLRISEEGEFIGGFLDTERLDWSGTPYDVVTAFDVFEHLYDPHRAIRNLAGFTKEGGVVVIETGDADSVAAGAIPHWYYLALFEHHIAWTAKSLAALAEGAAFELIQVEKKPHKLAPVPTGRPRLKWISYAAAPAVYHALQRVGGFRGVAPPKPGSADHLRVLLRKPRSGGA